MGRAKKNQYKIKTSGLEIKQSLLASWTVGKSDSEIIRGILIGSKYFNVLKNYDKGDRKIDLVRIKEHEVSN